MAQFFLLAALLVVVLLAWRLFKTSGEQGAAYETFERDAMPAELATGRLVYSERTFKADVPAPLAARVDQVFLTEEGTLVPLETKRRFKHRIWPADVIELSVQAAVLANHPEVRRVSRRVADYGYVRIAAEGRRSVYLRTPLLSQADVALLHDRYFELHAGEVAPEPAINPALCRKCAQRARCQVGRRVAASA